VQFTHERDTGLIRSVAFPEYCMVYAPAQPSPLGLVTCDTTQDAQVFAYSAEGTIQLKQGPSLCLAVGQASASAAGLICSM